MLKGFTRKFRPLEILTEEHVEDIHRATLGILQNTGLRVEHKRALKVFENNDCKVDYDQMRVRFPAGLVEECLRKTPSTWAAKARNPNNDVCIGGNTVYFCSFPGMQTIDLDTWEPRTATRKENCDGVRVLDALDNYHIMWTYTPYFGFEGVPPVMSIPESVAAQLRNSSKLLDAGYAEDCEIFTIKMAEVAGTEIIGNCLASAPLTYYTDAIESLFRFAEAGLPVSVCTSSFMGGTGPATIAGATVANNAETLGAIVLAQLIRPGTRMLADEFTFPLNMRTGSPVFGAVGACLHLALINQMFRRYGIPVHSASTGLSNSKKIDFQNGYEKMIMAFTAAIAGCNIIGLHGGLHGELTFHPVQAILDDDVAGIVGRFIEGVEVSDETLAMNLIEEVGPIPGFYLDKEHTRKWWNNEQFVPKVADRLTYPEWMKKGKKSTLDYGKEKMQEILARHEPEPLTPEQDKEIEKILEEARKYYKERGKM